MHRGSASCVMITTSESRSRARGLVRDGAVLLSRNDSHTYTLGQKTGNQGNMVLCQHCCHHGRSIARVHPVHLMNVERRQLAADLQTKPNDFGYILYIYIFIHHIMVAQI